MIKTKISAPEVRRKADAKSQPARDKLKIIPLGGLGEIGRNMTVLEYEDKIIVLIWDWDFPSLICPGLILLIPNTKYLEEKGKIKFSEYSLPTAIMTILAPFPI